MTAIAARSTNTYGHVHFGGDIISGIEAGVGVRIPGSATTANPIIEPFGDESNIGLTVKGKGSGTVTLGGSTGATVIAGATVRLNSSAVTVSTGSAFKGAYSTTFSWTASSIKAGGIAEVTLTTAVSSVLMPGDLVSVSLGTSLAAPIIMGGFRQSSVATSIVTILVAVPGSTGSSTLGSADGRITWLDLT